MRNEIAFRAAQPPQRLELLIAGGGTGGHVFPALEVAREWRRRAGPQQDERSVLMVGTQLGLETKLVPKAGVPLETIRAAGLKGVRGRRLLKNLGLLPAGLWDAQRIIRAHNFAAAFGVGGYASGPMMLAALMQGIPAVVFEPNLEPGFTNRLLAELAARVATAYPETARRWSGKGVVTGCPIRRQFFSIGSREHIPPHRLLITGGSQGAGPINRAVVAALPLLETRKNLLFIVHQAGERDYNAVRTAYAQRQLHAEVTPFIENMAERFAEAGLIICRSGAITVAEVAAAGRAAIFIPFAAATDSHQRRNAEGMRAHGAGCVVPQEELTGQRLTQEIFSLLDHPQRMRQMELRARSLATPHAAEHIVDLIEQVARS